MGGKPFQSLSIWFYIHFLQVCVTHLIHDGMYQTHYRMEVWYIWYSICTSLGYQWIYTQKSVLFSDTILSGASWFNTAWAHNPEKPALIFFACQYPLLWVGVGSRLFITAKEGGLVLILEPDEIATVSPRQQLGETGGAQSHSPCSNPKSSFNWISDGYFSKSCG